MTSSSRLDRVVLGRVVEDTSFWVPFAVSTGIAGALSAVFEVVRRTKLKVEDPGDDGRDE